MSLLPRLPYVQFSKLFLCEKGIIQNRTSFTVDSYIELNMKEMPNHPVHSSLNPRKRNDPENIWLIFSKRRDTKCPEDIILYYFSNLESPGHKGWFGTLLRKSFPKYIQPHAKRFVNKININMSV